MWYNPGNVTSSQRTYQFTGDVGRLREILTIVFEGSFETLVDRIGLGGQVPLECRIKCRRECTCDHPENGHCKMPHALPAPVLLRQILEQLGPTFIS